MWAKIITIKITKDLNYFSLCAFNLFNTRVSQFELNYWNKWTFPRHSDLLRCTCMRWRHDCSWKWGRNQHIQSKKTVAFYFYLTLFYVSFTLQRPFWRLLVFYYFCAIFRCSVLFWFQISPHKLALSCFSCVFCALSWTVMSLWCL